MQPSEGAAPGQTSDQNKENQDDATVKAAKAISESVFGHKLKERPRRSPRERLFIMLLEH